MPIAYTCPHCGKQYSVADQYAGQTGPCAACGQTITVPQALAQAPYTYAPQPATGSGGSMVAVIVIVGIIVLLCPGILIALLLPAVQAARTSARQAQASNNLKMLGLALHNYHDAYGSLPPAAVTDADGKPLYSGRVLLLPYFEQAAIYDQWDKSAAWDSPTNFALSQVVIPMFIDPSSTGGKTPRTDYVFITGAGTMFDPTKKAMFQNITDGTSNTIMMVEAQGVGGNWAEPKELDIASVPPLPPGHRPGGNLVLFGDGSVRMIPSSTPGPTIHAACTAQGGEPVALP
jgi:type II secretory pathway pseudopilin PulG